MQALAAGTNALAAMNASDAVQTAQAKPPTGDTATDAANQVGGINLSLSIGTSKSSSKTTQTNSTAQSSQVVAGGDINITATGDGNDSDINVVGSQVKAGNNITLKAEDEINLIAAKNNNTLNSKNKNSSASLGVSFGTSGLAVTASASQGKSKANGTDVTWTETALEAGNKVTLESGTDTNLIGAQVRGEQVVADVGTSGDGNLNIQSLQDTSTYDSKQKSAGISVSVPIGAGAYGGSISASNSNTKSNYASVNEQSGIFAGDEGFQVNVNGNTNLTGAVIASTEQAIADNKNSLTTQTLTISNIQNSATYEAKGSSATVG
jgi:filamentous hemagglutinin